MVMTMTRTEAVEAMFAHHRTLDQQLKLRVTSLTGAVAAGGPYDQEVADLLAYVADEVLPHAEAEEQTIYVAAAQGDLAGTVAEMIAEHRDLAAAAAGLASVPDGQAAARQAEAIAVMFSGHVAKENLILLPALLDRDEVDIAALLAEMHSRTEEISKAIPAGMPGRVTGAGSASGSGQAADLDVRELAPARRHESIFAAYQALAPGAGFVLINDHDPKPLRYQFEAEHAGEFSWAYLEEGPEVWRVRIGRTAVTT